MSLPALGRPFKALELTIESIIGTKKRRGVDFLAPIITKQQSNEYGWQTIIIHI
jgi:hypothetical protein